MRLSGLEHRDGEASPAGECGLEDSSRGFENTHSIATVFAVGIPVGRQQRPRCRLRQLPTLRHARRGALVSERLIVAHSGITLGAKKAAFAGTD